MNLMERREALHEALQSPNVRAFLRAIRLGEGTSDALGYRRVVGGGEFTGYEKHPEVRVRIVRYNVVSSAAGAFQIIAPTWRGLVAQYGFPDFSPSCQDEAAVALILEKGALADVKAGRVVEAIRKCKEVWASLPGSSAGQRTEALEDVLGAYRAHGGHIEGGGQ